MSEDQNIMRNVGTQNNAVSWLHQRAVALIYDELRRGEHTPSYTGRRESRPVSLRLPNGELTGNLNDGVQEVVIPGEWDQVGGIVPDLILYNDKREPVRIIEVIVTSPPNPEKQRKLDQLTKRGVDVVCVKVTESADLLRLCSGDTKNLTWGSLADREVRRGVYESRPRAANNRIEELMNALRRCEPEVRREFVELCRQIGSLEALYPVRPDNPLKDELCG